MNSQNCHLSDWIMCKDGACFSSDRLYRYYLWRYWGKGSRIVTFLMLNPSIADETVLDPTLRRCMGFAKDWGYSGMDIVNVFPLVSTDPKGLKVGISSNAEALNLLHIGESAKHAEIVVAAFGANVEKYAPKDLLVETGRVVPPEKLRAIAFNRDLRTPSHPLYLRKDLEPQPYTWQW